jgi:hypothetical protein
VNFEEEKMVCSIMDKVWLFVLLLSCNVKCVPTPVENWKEIDGNHRRDVAAFYNIYCEGPSYDGIVKDQITKMEMSGLMDKLDIVYYTTMGKDGSNYNISNQKFKHAKHFGDVGLEIQTLSLLYQFCHENVKSKVLYFHNKGSLHNSPMNMKFREFLDCFNLNPHCIDALDNHDICGWRLSPTPFPHFSGNFWWSTCKNINRLVDPLWSTNNETFIILSAKISPAVASVDRYFPERWVASAPEFRPADCMSAAVDKSYIWGYGFPGGVAEAHCRQPVTTDENGVKRRAFGMKCETASTFRDIKVFSNAIDYMYSQAPDNVYNDLIKRSYVYYGQPPVTYLKWMEPLRVWPNFTENMLVRPAHNKQVYVVMNKTLRGIPNLRTFINMGRDFDEVVPISDFSMTYLHVGLEMPSL